MKSKKILALALCAFLMIGSLFGCAQGGAKEITAPTKEVSQKLLDSLNFEYPLSPLPEKAANRLYKLDGEIIKEQSVYVGVGGALADEVSVWRVKDEKDAQTVKKAAEKRVENQKKSFENYVPAEMPKLEKAVITVNRDMVILCVSSNADEAKKIISSFEK